MSYLEDLRHQVEEARLLKQQQETQKRQETEQHNRRKKQAENFWAESGVGDLVAEVKKLLKIQGRLLEYVRTMITIEEEKKARQDPDSKIEILYWDKTADGSYSEETAAGSWGSAGHVYDQFKRNQGSIEALPDGVIIFRGNQDTRVPLEQWRISRDSIDSAMKTFLSNPEIKTFYDPSSGHRYSNPSGQHMSRGFPWE